MIPLKPTVTSLASQPALNVSMTLDVNTRLGRSSINRLAHSTQNFYAGTTQTDMTVQLEAAIIDPIAGIPAPAYTHTADLSHAPSRILQISTLVPVIALLTVNNVVQTIPVTKFLAVDSPVSRIELRNMNTDRPAQVILTYLT